jgi:hypothetical protein
VIVPARHPDDDDLRQLSVTAPVQWVLPRAGGLAAGYTLAVFPVRSFPPPFGWRRPYIIIALPYNRHMIPVFMGGLRLRQGPRAGGQPELRGVARARRHPHPGTMHPHRLAVFIYIYCSLLCFCDDDNYISYYMEGCMRAA